MQGDAFKEKLHGRSAITRDIMLLSRYLSTPNSSHLSGFAFFGPQRSNWHVFYSVWLFLNSSRNNKFSIAWQTASLTHSPICSYLLLEGWCARKLNGHRTKQYDSRCLHQSACLLLELGRSFPQAKPIYKETLCSSHEYPDAPGSFT